MRPSSSVAKVNADFAWCRRRRASEQPSSRSGQVTIGIRKKLTCFEAGFTNANQSWAFAPGRRRVGRL